MNYAGDITYMLYGFMCTFSQFQNSFNMKGSIFPGHLTCKIPMSYVFFIVVSYIKNTKEK